MTLAEFVETVEAHIANTGMTPTSFGRKYAGDPLFVFQLREGREPREATRTKVIEGMSAPSREAAA